MLLSVIISYFQTSANSEGTLHFSNKVINGRGYMQYFINICNCLMSCSNICPVIKKTNLI